MRVWKKKKQENNKKKKNKNLWKQCIIAAIRPMTATLTTKSIKQRITFSLEWVHLVIRRCFDVPFTWLFAHMHTIFHTLLIRSKFETGFQTAVIRCVCCCVFFFYLLRMIISSLHTQFIWTFFCLPILLFVAISVFNRDGIYSFIFLYDSLFIYTLRSISIFVYWFTQIELSIVEFLVAIERNCAILVGFCSFFFLYLSRKIPIGWWCTSIYIGIINGWWRARLFGYYSESTALYTWWRRTICSYN